MAERWVGSCAGETREVPGGAHVFKGKVLGDGSAKRIAHIDRYGALPSYSPFLVWELRLQLDPSTAKHVVVARPEFVRPLPVTSAELRAVVLRESAKKPPGFARWLRTVTLPHAIRRIEDVPPSLASAVRFVRDALQPGRFYSLLPFFPAGFLRQFDEGQLETVWEVFRENNEIFAFWDVAERQLRARGIPAEKVQMAPRQAIGKERFEMRYREGRPALSLPLLCLPSDHAASVEAALRWSERAWSRFVWCGDTWHEKPRAPGALEVMLELGSVVETRGAGIAFRAQREAEDNLQAQIERIPTVRTIQTQMGAAELAHRLSQERPRSVAFGASESRIARTAWVPPVPTKDEPLYVVQAHKMGPAELGRILEDLNPSELILLGDEQEGAANYARGGGDVFRAARRYLASEEEWALADARLVRDIRARRNVGVEVGNEVEFAKIFGEWWTKEGREKMAFCSDETTRTALLKRIDKTDLRPGRRVHVLDVDLVGILGSATEVETGRALPRTEHLRFGLDYEISLEEVNGFVRTPIWNGRSAHVSIERADVAIASKYPGPPLPVVVFFASKFTSLDELCAATKHAAAEFRVVWLPGASVTTASDKRRFAKTTMFL